jgi:hypothetical protein
VPRIPADASQLPPGWRDYRDLTLFLLGVACLGYGVAFEVGEERIILFTMSAALMGLPGAIFAYHGSEDEHAERQRRVP